MGDDDNTSFNKTLIKLVLFSIVVVMFCWSLFIGEYKDRVKALESIKPKVSKEITNDYLKIKYGDISLNNVFYPLGNKENTDTLGLKCQSKMDDKLIKIGLDDNKLVLVGDIERMLSDSSEYDLRLYFSCLNDLLEVTLVSDESIADLINSDEYKKLKAENNPKFVAKVDYIKENGRMTAKDGYELIKIINDNKKTDSTETNKQKNIAEM